METKGKDLINHWNWAAEKGLMNKNSAYSFRSACTQVLSVLDDWESIEVSELDIDDLILRFKNLKAKKFKPQSLAAYDRRFRRAVQLFNDYVSDPSRWKPSNIVSTGEKKRSKNDETGTEVTSGSVNEGGSGIVENNSMVNYPFPLRPDSIAGLKSGEEMPSTT